MQGRRQGHHDPERRLAVGPRRRACRHRRRERRRQDDPARHAQRLSPGHDRAGARTTTSTATSTSDLFRQGLGYVPQDDIVHPELTVHQTLYYAARLRLPSDTSGAEIERLIEEVLEQPGADPAARHRRPEALGRPAQAGQHRRRAADQAGHLLPGRADLGPGPGPRPPDDGADAQAGRRRPHRHPDDPRHPQRHALRQGRVHGARRPPRLLRAAGRGADVLRRRRLHRDLQHARSGGRPPGCAQTFRQSEVYERNVAQRLTASASRREPAELVGAQRERAEKRKGANWLAAVVLAHVRYLRHPGQRPHRPRACCWPPRR